jgi:hypothetical protein
LAVACFSTCSFFRQTLAPDFFFSINFFTFIIFSPFSAGQALGQSPSFFTIFTTVSPVVDTVIAPFFISTIHPRVWKRSFFSFKPPQRLARSDQQTHIQREAFLVYKSQP